MALFSSGPILDPATGLRNNLWISVNGGKLWDFESGTPDWRTSLDYDGFDRGGAATAFQYLSVNHPDLASFVAASGLEPHGVPVSRARCFPTLDVPGPPPASVPAQVLVPAAGCEGIDRGEVVPNLSDGYLGAAPDLGAFEAGAPAPVFGPR